MQMKEKIVLIVLVVLALVRAHLSSPKMSKDQGD